MDPYYRHSIKLKAERVRHLQKNRTNMTIKDLYTLMSSFLSLYYFGQFYLASNHSFFKKHRQKEMFYLKFYSGLIFKRRELLNKTQDEIMHSHFLQSFFSIIYLLLKLCQCYCLQSSAKTERLSDLCAENEGTNLLSDQFGVCTYSGFTDSRRMQQVATHIGNNNPL